MAYTEQDYQEIKARLLAESQGVGDVPEAVDLNGISTLPAYQEAEGQDMPNIVRAPLTLLAAPALAAASKANEATINANEKAALAQTAADNAYNTNMGIVFMRTNSENIPVPTGGSFENPMPIEAAWTKEVPTGLGRLWVSMRRFTSNGINQEETWSTPANLTYNQYLEFATSTIPENPGTPDTNPENWTNKGGADYIWIAIQMVYNGTKKGWNVSRVTPDLSQLIESAQISTDAANVATASANQAAIEANQSADTADKKALLAEQAAASANDTANHPTYIGTDHYVYKWNKVTSAYDKTDIYTKGDAFSIKKVYASVAALQSDVNNTDISEGDFVLVNTNDVENPDNAKLYVKVKNSDGTFSYSFLVDMSGAIGFTGKTPQFSMGNISTLEAGLTATATVSEDGTDSDGNPKYRINFAIPRGNPGAPFRVAGQYATVEALNAAVPDGSAVDGFMAVGAEVPYNYYAWANGTWKDQGQIAGGSGNIVNIPPAVLNLTSQSTSAEIFNAFGGKEAFIEICKKVYDNKDAVCVSSAEISEHNQKIVYTFLMSMASYTDENNAVLGLVVNAMNQIIQCNVLVSNGVATLIDQTINLLAQSDIANDFNGEVDKVLSAAMGNKLNDEKASKEDVLTKTNTTEFFPTADYHPATKKYVDDNLPKYLKKSNGDEGWIRIAAFTYKTTFVATLTIMPDDSYVSPAVIIISGESMESKFIIHTLFKATDSYDNIKKIRTIVNATTNVGYVDIMYDHYSDFFYNITNNVNIEAVATVDDNTIPSGFSVGKEYDLNTSTVVSDNITTITKKTAAEYAAVTTKDSKTIYTVID